MTDFTTVTLSCYATKDYIKALRIIAARRDTTIGKMVRIILDQALAKELAEEGQVPFVEEDVQSKAHSKHTRNKRS